MTKAQKRMKRARVGAWSPAARAKRRATYEAKRAAREAGEPVRATRRGDASPVHDAIVFLEKAEKAILTSGKRRFAPAEVLAMLALATLRGEV